MTFLTFSNLQKNSNILMQIEDLIFSQKRTKGGLDFAYLGVSQVKSLPIAESAACSGLFDPNKFV